MNSKRLDYILLPALLLSLFISSYFLVSDKLDYNLIELDPIAKVISKNNTVKTKKKYNYHWINTVDGDKLSPNDQIYTHEDSFAKVKLNDGGVLSISPNTLVTLSKEGEEETINVGKGIILAELSDKNKSVKVQLGSKIIEITSNKAKVQIVNTDQGPTVDLIEGNAQVKSNDTIKDLEKGSRVKVKDKEIKVSKVEVQLSKPLNNQIYRENQRVNFAWIPKNNSTGLISKSLNFKKVKKISNEEVLILKRGIYYWKVKSKEAESMIRSITVLPKLTTSLISPTNESIIVNDKKITLKWKDNYSEKFVLKVQTPSEVITKKVEGHSYELSVKEFGTYKWSATPDLNIKSYPSKVSSFEITRPFLPSPPKVITPSSGESITLFNNSTFPITWKGKNNAQYEVVFSESKNFQKIFLTLSPKKNFIHWAPTKSGTYYFKVREIDLLNRETPFSKVISLSIDIFNNSNFIPQTGSKIELKRPKEEVTFKWKKGQKVEEKRPKYLIEVSNSKDFNTIISSKETVTNSAKMTFPKLGNYYWRTKVIYPDNKEFYSSPQRVTISPTPAPKKPSINDLNIEIKVNYILEAIKSIFTKVSNLLFPPLQASELNTSAKIQWNKEENAKEYILEIYQDEELSKSILSTRTKENYYLLSNIKEGTYYWRIATIDFWDRKSPFSDVSKIHLSLPSRFKKVERAELLSPKNYQTFKGTRALVDFKWTKVKSAKKYVLLISKKRSFSKIYVKRTLDRNSFSIRLSLSSYYWKVISYNQFGYKSSSKANRFIIKREARKVSPKVTKEKKKTKKKMSLKKSYFFFQYDILSSTFEQNFSNYQVNAKDLVFTSFELGLNHQYSPNYYMRSKISSFSGKVYNGLSYGVKSIEAILARSLFNSKIVLGIGASFNNYTSYFREGQNLKDKSNSALSIPFLFEYNYLLLNKENTFGVIYSFGGLRSITIQNRSTIFNKLDFGLEYKKYSSDIDNTKLKISNLKASFRYLYRY